MLQINTKPNDICRISKLLAKHNIKASITNSVITLYGDVSDELLTQLCGVIDINGVQNFINEEPLYVPKETAFFKSKEHIQTGMVEEPKQIESTVVEENEKVEASKTHTTLSHPSECNLLYPKVKRGEVYWCDFGEAYGHEQGGFRPAIIVQNDTGNSHSPTTIVIACTTAHKKRLPVHFCTRFSHQNMLDYDPARVGSANNVIMAEFIRTVDKTRLRKYMGSLTPEFMKIIDEKVEISLHLHSKSETIEKDEV